KALASTASISKLTPVNFAGRRWTLRFTQPGGLASTADYGFVWLVFLSGTIISLLLFGLTVSLFRTRVNARRMAEQLTTELRASEEKYRVVFNNEIYAICIFDLETLKLLEVNAAYERLYGYSREERTAGMTIHDITAEHQVSDAATTQATREGTIFIPLRYHRKKGGIVFPVEIVGGPYEWQGRKVMFALAHDISARKHIQDELHASEMHYRALVEGIPGIIYSFSDKRGGVFYSSHVMDILGYSPEQLCAQPLLWHNSIHPDDILLTEQVIDEAAADKPFHIEYRIRDAHGNWLWFDDRSICYQVDEDEVIIEGFAQDITDRKQMELALLESEAKYRSSEWDLLEAQTVAHIGSWKWDLEKEEVTWSDEMFRIFGIDKNSYSGRLGDAIAKVIHPEDLHIVQSANAQPIAEKKPFEYRIILPDGTIRYIWAKAGDLLINQEDKPTFIIGIAQDITERKQMESQVQEQAYFPALNPGPTLRVDAAGFVKLANPAAISFGLEVGTSLTELLPSNLVDCIRAGKTQIFEANLNGRIFQLTLRGVPAMNQAFVYGSDITETKLLKEKYRTVADFTYDWEAWRAPDNTYLYVSPSCERISGHTAAEFIANPNLTVQISHPDDQPAVIAHYHESGNGSRKQDLSLDFRIVTAKGDIRWINHWCTAVFGESGLWLGRRESNRDITERKQAEYALQDSHDLLEQRVQERTTELSAANLDLEKAARMKDEFLAAMSHELRTPLTGILGLSEVMQLPGHDPLTEKQSSYLTNIHKSGQRLLVIINDMLDYSMIESGKFNLSLNPCSLEEICQSSLQLIESQAAAKGLQSNLSIIPESILLNTDARRLQKILVNLLGNAVKFTPKGGSFGIEALGDRTAGQVQITVWDSGIGIKEEDLPRLFQPFIQLDARLARQYEGTGLGLAMVRRLTELHGGSVTVQSVVGQGSRFTVCLPWQPASVSWSNPGILWDEVI
ncbi:MAG: PAS domain S-box protein, partial [Chloroflexota bacterium]